MALHEDEVAITDDLVARLVARDLPDLAQLPLRRLTVSGSTNVLFSLGSEFVIRLPRQPGGSKSLAAEARWLPHVAAHLPVEVPQVVALGDPGFGYPERWALARWVDGESPEPPVGSAALARDLARFAKALHAVPVPGAAANDPALRSYRTRPLRDMDAGIRKYLQDCRRLPGLPLDLDACTEVWARAVELPPSSQPARWAHTDLLAENLLVRDDRLAAVLDFGGLSVGDPSVDLIVAWEVLGPEAREIFRKRVDVDETTWLHGRGWALAIAIMTFPYYWHSMPARCAARLAMAQQVLADAGRLGPPAPRPAQSASNAADSTTSISGA